MIRAEEHIKLVYYVASRINTTAMEYEDIVGNGMIGLVHAANKFNEKKGVKFSTYAVNVIYGYILNALKSSCVRNLGSRTMKVNGEAIIPISIEEYGYEKFEVAIRSNQELEVEVIEKVYLEKLLSSVLKETDIYLVNECIFLGRSQSDVAKELNVTRQNIYQQLKKIKGKLRLALDEENYVVEEVC